MQALPIRQIKVSSVRTDQPLQITNLSTSLTNLTVELVTVETGKVYSVVAKFTESPKYRSAARSVLIRTRLCNRRLWYR